MDNFVLLLLLFKRLYFVVDLLDFLVHALSLFNLLLFHSLSAVVELVFFHFSSLLELVLFLYLFRPKFVLQEIFARLFFVDYFAQYFVFFLDLSLIN